MHAVNAAGPEGWSARDVVAHLASIQRQANVQRVRLMLDHDNPVIPNMDEDEVLNASGFRSRRRSARRSTSSNASAPGR